MIAAEAEIRLLFVIPAKAGIQAYHTSHWIPACAGMTKVLGGELDSAFAGLTKP